MRRAAVVLLGWGLWLGVMTAVQLAFAPVRPRSVGLHPIEYEMLGSASGACLLSGLALWWLDARRRATEGLQALPESSLASASLAGGLALALLGAGFGLWLILIGAAVTLLGAGGLVREQRARRRDRRLGGAP
jgi:hypothetical protein